ncbi:transcriptional regulator [Paenibacillus sp. 598K]|uniref:helix-turn-helix domain-containing protein n=1 Tax=Paenibacillus sp. 598K TaxID=1117987 RepID=UPI000FFA7EE4|nr:helix-turn-helix transcriptional regulator [Paenibacillus sp. 598K]GBF78457.1 transcriptional regulator [Paenibacillus sp. 598K]
MKPFTEQLGAKIRLHRLAQGLTQEQLAERSNTTPSYIGQLERGEKDIRISTLEKVALALNLDLHDMFTNEKESFLKQHKWVWEGILLQLRHPEERQEQAYRILKELLEPNLTTKK